MRHYLAILAAVAFVCCATASFGSDPEFLRKYEQARHAAGLSRRAAPMELPARTAGSPEYLVRVLYYVPSDRVPEEDAAWDAKVAEAAGRIRLVGESLEDYFAWQMEEWGAANPGKRINFERNVDSSIRVIGLKGRVETKGANGLWGDNDGLDWVRVHFEVLDDIFGDDLTIRESFFEKTTYLIFSDAMEMHVFEGAGEFRGYLGGGSSYRSNSSGWGGYGHISAGILELWEQDPGTTEEARFAALASSLCNTENPVTVAGVTAPVYHRAPSDGVTRALMRGELASVYMGVIAHELTHAFGLVHDWVTPDALMFTGYVQMGEAYRVLHGLETCEEVPLSGVGGGYSKLGEPFSEVLSHCPYFQTETNPDKSDPKVSFAWPPAGYIDSREVNGKAFQFRLRGSDAASGANALLLYSQSELVDNALIDNDDSAPASFTPFWWDQYIGARTFNVSHYGKAGNHALRSHVLLNFYFDANTRGIVANNTLYVRRPANEDTRARNAGAAKGSFLNPYNSIADAVNAAKSLTGRRTIIVCAGTYPIAETIKLYPDITVTGEEVGLTILDGGGMTAPIILDDSVETRLQNVTIANLVFQNAQAGIKKTATHNQSWHLTISNNIFRDLTGEALHHTLMWGTIVIEQNTIVDCGTGIHLEGWAPFTTSDHFTMRNNTVSDCATGISMVNLGPFREQGESGYNNSWNNSANWAGNGSFGGVRYDAVRLPGEFSGNPQFKADRYTPMRFSALLRSGHPETENKNGTRRDVGAVIDNEASVHGWVLMGE